MFNRHPSFIYFFRMISAVGTALVLVVAVMGCIVKKYFSNHGAYQTNEAREHNKYDTPDAAVSLSNTGQPEISTQKEWMI